MPKKILQAAVHVPEYPRVRFFKTVTDGVSVVLKDCTEKVAKLIVIDLEDGRCALQRLDDEGQLVWETRHASLKETKWHVEFEYGLPEEKWLTFSECLP